MRPGWAVALVLLGCAGPPAPPSAPASPIPAAVEARAAVPASPAGVVLDLRWTWTFADDLDAASHATYRAVVQRWAAMLWHVGEGNFALRAVRIVDRCSLPAELHTPAGSAAARMLRPGGLWAHVVTRAHTLQGGAGRVMEIPGHCDAYTWLHELGHRLFECPEEYDSTPGCACVESTGANGGAWRWCDARTHCAAQAAQHPPCWEGYILPAYPAARHPGPAGSQPPCRVTFDDR